MHPCIYGLLLRGSDLRVACSFACWEDVRDIKFDDLEYNAVETWQQHLEVYSSVCEVQNADKIVFLLDKIGAIGI